MRTDKQGGVQLPVKCGDSQRDHEVSALRRLQRSHAGQGRRARELELASKRSQEWHLPSSGVGSHRSEYQCQRR